MRTSATTFAILAFLQPVLAGRFLSGDYAVLDSHRTNASVVGLLAIIQIVVALLAWRIGRAPRSILGASAGLAVACALQIALGYARILGLHVPLGVLIVGGAASLLIQVWRAGPAGQPS
jgi:hypothetical protein